MEICSVKPQTVSEGRGPDSRRCHCNLHNPSGRTMPLGSTQPLKNDLQEYFQGGKESRCVRLTTLLSSSADCLEI
jgi:hypothetical protein